MENLLSEKKIAFWTAWAPREHLMPAMRREGDSFFIDSNGRFEAYGVWKTESVPCREGAHYFFSAELETFNCTSPDASAYCILTWLGADGALLSREYAADKKKLANGAVRLGRSFTAPEGASRVVCEMCFRWSAGRAVYSAPSFVETPPLSKRVARVAAAYVSFPYPRTLEGNERAILEMIDEAGSYGVDIVCLSEVVNADGVDLPLRERSAVLPGPLTERIGAYAKKHNIYVVIGLSELNGELCHNCAALIGRDGGYIGCYRKVQLPLSEAEAGYTPGSSFPVFDTDFGRIGMMICWDQGFPEIARSIANAGAEIIFVPTMWYSDFEAKTRAAENAIYLVTCARPHDEYPARIIDPSGEVIALQKGSAHRDRGLAFADIDLNERFYKHWMSVGPCDGERACFRAERRYDAYGPSIIPRAAE